MTNFVDAYLDETVSVLANFRDEPAFRATMGEMADTITACLRQGGKLLVCGNGGSAGDAQHIAGEFISRLMYDRAPLAAIALTTDTSVITATGNDYGYEHVFERQVRGLGRKGDVLLGISTSGTSPNVIRAFEAAKALGVTCLGFSGARQNTPMHTLCDQLLAAPSTKTAIIQQVHIVAAHVICALVEMAMFPRNEA